MACQLIQMVKAPFLGLVWIMLVDENSSYKYKYMKLVQGTKDASLRDNLSLLLQIIVQLS